MNLRPFSSTGPSFPRCTPWSKRFSTGAPLPLATIHTLLHRNSFSFASYPPFHRLFFATFPN